MNDLLLSILLLGAFSGGTGNPLPFWATTNQWGLMPETQGTLAVAQAKMEFDASRTFQYRWGASLAMNSFQNDLSPDSNPIHLIADELYGSLRWKSFTLDLGIRHRELDFYGADSNLGSLSTTGGHIAESGNARAMPGYLLSLSPISLPWTNKHLWLYGAYGDYKPLGINYVDRALVHRTRLGLRFDISQRLRFHFMLDHYAVWGGDIPNFGIMQINLDNYLRAVLGLKAGADGTMRDRLNVIGDQGGGELLRAEYFGDGWNLVFQHDIPYNDGSGMGFQNFPDGVNTFHFGWNDKSRWISDIVYEYIYTMYQSGPINGEQFDKDGHSITPEHLKTTGGDNYFNNGIYRSGWTHFGHTICVPLMYPAGTRNHTWTSSNLVLGIENNRLKAHHFALSGSLFKRHPYKLMLTYSQNYGTYKSPYAGESTWQKEWGTVKETPLRQLSAGISGSIRLASHRNSSIDCSILYGIYADRGSILPDIFGISLGARVTFR